MRGLGHRKSPATNHGTQPRGTGTSQSARERTYEKLLAISVICVVVIVVAVGVVSSYEGDEAEDTLVIVSKADNE